MISTLLITGNSGAAVQRSVDAAIASTSVTNSVAVTIKAIVRNNTGIAAIKRLLRRFRHRIVSLVVANGSNDDVFDYMCYDQRVRLPALRYLDLSHPGKTLIISKYVFPRLRNLTIRYPLLQCDDSAFETDHTSLQVTSER